MIIKVFSVNFENDNENDDASKIVETCVATFESEEKARVYILEHTVAGNQYFYDMSASIRDEVDYCKFMVEFCFDNDKYLIYRNLFLNKVPTGKLREILQER